MKTLIAIPCYRCQNQIVRVLSALVHSKVYSEISEVMVIDNQSPDGTRDSVQEFLRQNSAAKKISLWLNDENYGLGGSQKIAFDQAAKSGFEALVILHGDDQASVDDIETLLLALKADRGLAAVLGSRFMKGSRLEGYQKSRIWGNRILNFIFSLFCTRKTLDLGSGLNAFSLLNLQEIEITKLDDGFTFNVDFLLSLYSKNLKLRFLPILWRESDQSSNARNFRVAFGMLSQLFFWRFGFQKKPGHPIGSSQKISS